jgi:N-acetylglucosamine malate deacetylase 2
MERILVVLPHPDDEAFGLSGTISKAIREGSPVTYACLTLGEMGRNLGVPPIASRATLPIVRRRELEESCRVIGIQDLRMLGFHDKTLEFENKDKLDGAIAALIEELQPTLVLTFYPGYAVHPDHDATGEAVVRTVGRMPKASRPVVRAMAFARNAEEDLGKPDVLNDIRPFIEQKIAAVRAHKSQFQFAESMTSGKEKEMLERLGTERFWTYQFD